MKKTQRILTITLLLGLLAMAGLLWYVSPVVNGYAARYLCAHAYTVGLDATDGHTRFVKSMNPLFRFTVPTIDAEKKEVTVAYFGFLRPRKAVWRKGCGCTLLVDKSVSELRTAHHDPDIDGPDDRILSDRDVLWLAGNRTSRDSMRAEINWAAIDSLLDYGMAEATDDPGLKTNTLALVIAWDGQIIGERYAEGVTDSTSLLGWSAAKSVLGALYGVLVQAQGLDIHQPAGLPEWASDDRRHITIDQLLRMESGLDFDEDYGGVTDATRMLYASSSMGTFAAHARLSAAPGTAWSYSSGTSNILARLLYEKAGGAPEALHRLMYDYFFDKIGVTTAVWEHDESGALVGSSYLYMSARDWLRVCQLYMNDGVWNGERILPKGWVTYSLSPTPHAPDARFGAHIWLNAAEDPANRMMPGLPRDLFIFKGFQGQWIIGIPSRGLMVARLGVDSERRWDAQGVVGGLLEVLELNN